MARRLLSLTPLVGEAVDVHPFAVGGLARFQHPPPERAICSRVQHGSEERVPESVPLLPLVGAAAATRSASVSRGPVQQGAGVSPVRHGVPSIG